MITKFKKLEVKKKNSTAAIVVNDNNTIDECTLVTM